MMFMITSSTFENTSTVLQKKKHQTLCTLKHSFSHCLTLAADKQPSHNNWHLVDCYILLFTKVASNTAYA